MKDLTIFTPTYNRASLLTSLYQSLCKQINKDFVWLIVDDGSKDKTKELIQEWKKSKYNRYRIHISRKSRKACST